MNIKYLCLFLIRQQNDTNNLYHLQRRVGIRQLTKIMNGFHPCVSRVLIRSNPYIFMLVNYVVSNNHWAPHEFTECSSTAPNSKFVNAYFQLTIRHRQPVFLHSPSEIDGNSNNLKLVKTTPGISHNKYNKSLDCAKVYKLFIKATPLSVSLHQKPVGENLSNNGSRKTISTIYWYINALKENMKTGNSRTIIH